jgi:aspartate/tyrosine/aromatic aminotransferase
LNDDDLFVSEHGEANVASGCRLWRRLFQQALQPIQTRVRIKAMRQKLVDGLKAAGVKQNMSFITSQIGMFSYTGITRDQMVRLRHRLWPHVRGRAQQQEHRPCLPGDRQGDVVAVCL